MRYKLGEKKPLPADFENVVNKIIIENHGSVKDLADYYNYSYNHMFTNLLDKKLAKQNPELYKKVKNVLDENKTMRICKSIKNKKLYTEKDVMRYVKIIIEQMSKQKCIVYKKGDEELVVLIGDEETSVKLS